MRCTPGGVGITERAAQRIVADLIAAEYISRVRDGRRNRYTVRTDLPIGLPAQRDVDLGSLIHVLVAPGTDGARSDLLDREQVPG